MDDHIDRPTCVSKSKSMTGNKQIWKCYTIEINKKYIQQKINISKFVFFDNQNFIVKSNKVLVPYEFSVIQKPKESY